MRRCSAICRIDAHIARTQFGQIMDLAVKNNERFIVDRRGEPTVVIMSIQDFIRTAAPPPDWLHKAWAGAKHRGLEALTQRDLDTEIAAYRREKGSHQRQWSQVIRAVIDTNVLVSGLLRPSGNEALILLAIHQGLVRPCFSTEILEEYAAVLARPKFSFPADEIAALIEMLRRSASANAGKGDLRLDHPELGDRDAVYFESSGEKGRGVDHDDQARRSVRYSSSSASISSSVRPCARASRLASAIGSVRTSRARPPFSRLLRWRPTASRRARLSSALAASASTGMITSTMLSIRASSAAHITVPAEPRTYAAWLANTDSIRRIAAIASINRTPVQSGKLRTYFLEKHASQSIREAWRRISALRMLRRFPLGGTPDMNCRYPS